MWGLWLQKVETLRCKLLKGLCYVKLLPPLGAFGYVGLAVEAGETRLAGAGVAVDIVGASASVLAGRALALVYLDGAPWPREAGQAGAVEGVNAVRAGASAETWICGRMDGWMDRKKSAAAVTILTVLWPRIHSLLNTPVYCNDE